MDTDKFTDLPDWDEGNFLFKEDEGEEWKPNPTREACRVLYAKWQEVVFLLKGILVPVMENEDGEYAMQAHAAADFYEDALTVAVKIKSSEAVGIYTLRMENAAIIRKAA